MNVAVAPPTYDLQIASLAGLCPVQGQGTINGLPWYFRARHDYWTFSVALSPDGDPIDLCAFPGEGPGFHMQRPYGRKGAHQAGYMPEKTAFRCIWRGARAFAAWWAEYGAGERP